MVSNLAQTDNDRNVMLAGVAHDLRTPLARLRLRAEMLDECDRIARNYRAVWPSADAVRADLRAGPHFVLPAATLERVLSNLLDNAQAYGAPPMVIKTARTTRGFTLRSATRVAAFRPRIWSMQAVPSCAWTRRAAATVIAAWGWLSSSGSRTGWAANAGSAIMSAAACASNWSFRLSRAPRRSDLPRRASLHTGTA